MRLGDVLAAARERHPLLEIELHHEVSGAAFAKVRNGELDASYYYGPLAHAEIASVPLTTLVYRVAAPAAWRDRVENADDAAIAALPWIMTPPISTHHALATHFFAARGLAPATVLEADNELVIRSLVVSGVGVALIREDLALAAAAADEVVLWEPAHIETALQFIWSRCAHVGGAARRADRGRAADVAGREAADRVAGRLSPLARRPMRLHRRPPPAHDGYDAALIRPKRPPLKSAIACAISACVFITNGP